MHRGCGPANVTLMSLVETSWRRRLQEGLHASVRGNAQAFGFSITVTVTFGVVSQLGPPARVIDLFLFALSGVAAFSLLNVLVVHQMDGKHRDRTGERATLIGTATDFVAVGAAVGAAIGLATVLRNGWIWLLAPFVAGVVYVLVQAVELAVGREETDHGNDPEPDDG